MSTISVFYSRYKLLQKAIDAFEKQGLVITNQLLRKVTILIKDIKDYQKFFGINESLGRVCEKAIVLKKITSFRMRHNNIRKQLNGIDELDLAGLENIKNSIVELITDMSKHSNKYGISPKYLKDFVKIYESAKSLKRNEKFYNLKVSPTTTPSSTPGCTPENSPGNTPPNSPNPQRRSF